MKIVSIIGAGVVTLVVGFFVLGPPIAEQVAFYKLPAEIKANYHDWKTKKLELPAEALEVKPVSKETQAACQAYLGLWNKDKDQAIKLTGEWHINPATALLHNEKPGDLPTLRRELDGLQPLVAAYVKMAMEPDYGISACVEKDDRVRAGLLPFPNLLAMQWGAKLLRLTAYAQTREGKVAEALETAYQTVCAGKTAPYDDLIGQLIGIAVSNLGVLAWQDAVLSCSDPKLLHRALEQQNQLAGQMRYFPEGLPINTLENIGMLRQAKSADVKVDFQGLTERELAVKYYATKAEYLQTIVLPAVQNDPKRNAEVLQQIKMYQSRSETIGGPSTSMVGNFRRLSSNVASPILFRIAIPNEPEARTRARLVQNKLDLLRLETARKLFTIERGKALAKDAELVPDYLAALPGDRFAKDKAPYRHAATGAVDAYYSIGPDGNDQGLKTIYDPTNGTVSGGDIALAR